MNARRHPPFKAGEEAREMGRRAAAHCNKIRRLKKTMRQWAEIFRDTPSKADPNMTMGAAAVLKMYNAAIKGDVRAAQFLAELQGEMEAQVSIKELPKMIDDI